MKVGDRGPGITDVVGFVCRDAPKMLIGVFMVTQLFLKP